MFRNAIYVTLATLAATSAQAEFTQVNDRDTFLQLVVGKTLTRTLVKLEVTADGRIAGNGARWAVTGNWTWQDGYFCRDLDWGGDALGYNCQEVRENNGRIRFTSDRGTGQSAVFRLE